MRKLISISLCVVLFVTLFSTNVATANGDKTNSNGDFSLSARNFCLNIKAGWNLGNTLESAYLWGNIPQNPTPTEQETGWNNPVTTQEMIDFVAKSGFNAIRIPVTWGTQLTQSGNKYTIKSNWMARVKQVVSYAQKNDMYIIVNMHHDDKDWLDISASDAQWSKIKDKYKQLWVQIADAFKDYDEKLILEGANEIVATKSFDGCGSSSSECWWGHSEEVFERQNEIYQIFVDTVRSSGGNNDKRYLMLPTYGAQWYDNQMNNLLIPNNDQHIIMDIHWYKGNPTDSNANKVYFDKMRNFCNSNKIGCVIGECGFSKNTSDTTKTNWTTNFINVGKKLGIPCFLWDDGGDMAILNRSDSTLSWNSVNYINNVISKSNNALQPGDTNLDGKFENSDVLYLANYFVGKRAFSNPSTLADVNKDGKIDVKDYLYLRKILAEIITFDDVA